MNPRAMAMSSFDGSRVRNSQASGQWKRWKISLDEEETEAIPDHLELLEQIKLVCSEKFSQEFTTFLARIANNCPNIHLPWKLTF